KLLQLSNLELTAYVEEELERNPLLERAADEEGFSPEPAPPESDAGPREELASTDRFADEAISSQDGMEDHLGNGVDNVYADDGDAPAARAGTDGPSSASEWANVGSGGSADGDYNLEAFVSAERTLSDH